MKSVPFYLSDEKLFDYDKYREMWGSGINSENGREVIPNSWEHKKQTMNLYYDERNSILINKYNTAKMGWMFIESMPYNVDGNKTEALLFLKKFLEEHPINIRLRLNKLWMAYFIKAMEKLKIETHELYDVKIFDYTYYDIIKDRLELMRTAKWRKDKTRGLLKDPDIKFKVLEKEDYNKVVSLYPAWDKSKRGANARPVFYERIFESNFNGMKLFGLFYKDVLILVEGVQPMGKTAFSLFAFGVSDVELGKKVLGLEIPKKVLSYMNLTLRSQMYEVLDEDGFIISDAGFIGSNKEECMKLKEHKKNTYMVEIPKYSGKLRTKIGGRVNDRF